MSTQVFNGTSLTTFSEQVHNGTSLVPLVEYVHNGTSLVPVTVTATDGPVPVVAATMTAGQSANVATTSVTLPTGLAAGDLLLTGVDIRSSGATASIPGWTVHTAAAVTSGQQSLQFLSRFVVDASDAAALSGAVVTLTSTAAVRQVIRVLRITGARVVDVVGGGSGTSTGTSRTIGPVTTAGANRLLVAMWGTSDSTITITGDAAMTVVGTQTNSGGTATNHQALLVATQAIATAGSTGTRTATLSATTISGGQLIAIAPVLV